MTPAEEMAAKKKEKQAGKRAGRCYGRHTIWHCQLLDMRMNLGLTPLDIGKSLVMSGHTLYAIENGADTTLTNARKIAAFFGVTVEEMWPKLLEEDGNEESA